MGARLPGIGVLVLAAAVGPSCNGERESMPTACAAAGADLTCAPGFAGYECAGAARPDQDGDFVDGVPRGLVCTDRGPVGPSGREGYCCTSSPTPCAYDPVAICAAPTYGYRCRGSDRPEAFDPTLFCGEGLVVDGLIDYCCGPTPRSYGCSQVSGHACPTSLVGWTCHDTSLPSEEELGANQSRADFNLLVCSVPTLSPASAGTVRQYCCFTPTSLPAGGSCLADTTVPGCPPDSFGFACTGVDTPDEDYPEIRCSAGSRGTNPQGYAATLYCCLYQGAGDGG
ncbi:MAG TPA: hypothetical protein VKU41_25205 [Polyangiaceae bacterium]|nr:hypothetical protein [Polyangiaceae bacterium]